MVPQFFVPRNYGTQTENWEQGTRKLGAPTTLRAQSGNTETENNMNVKQRYRLTRLAHHKQSHKYVVRSQIFAPPPQRPEPSVVKHDVESYLTLVVALQNLVVRVCHTELAYVCVPKIWHTS